MASIGWGKPKIWISKLSALGAPTTWVEVPTPVQDSTQLVPTKGDKKEAKVEGGENEAVKYMRNTYALEFSIRAAEGRAKLAEDDEGVISGEYALKLQPEDPDVTGIAIDRGTLSFEPSYTAEDGVLWKYVLDALIPTDTTRKSVEFEVITDPTASNSGGQ